MPCAPKTRRNMMAYKWFLHVEIEALDDIDELTRNDLFLIFAKLKELLYADDPTDQNQVTDIKKLKAPEYRGLWRKRAGNHRILYRIEEGELTHLKTKYKGKLIVARVLNRRDL